MDRYDRRTAALVAAVALAAWASTWAAAAPQEAGPGAAPAVPSALHGSAQQPQRSLFGRLLRAGESVAPTPLEKLGSIFSQDRVEGLRALAASGEGAQHLERIETMAREDSDSRVRTEAARALVALRGE